MEEKKNKFFDLNLEGELDLEQSKKEEPVRDSKSSDAFSKVFGNVEVNQPVKQEEKKVPTFQDVFKTELVVEEPKVEPKKESVSSAPTSFNSVSKAQEVFKTEMVVDEPKKEEPKKEEIINSSKFFNTATQVEEPKIEIKQEAPLYVEKVGDNPMIDYDRINREAEENRPPEEEKEEIPKEDPSQINNTMNRRIIMGGSDLMKLRMTRR